MFFQNIKDEEGRIIANEIARVFLLGCYLLGSKGFVYEDPEQLVKEANIVVSQLLKETEGKEDART